MGQDQQPYFRQLQPFRDVQLSFFPESLPALLKRLNVSSDELKRWYAREWLSFNPLDHNEFQDGEANEVHLVRDVARSGLSDEVIDRLLGELPLPFGYHPQRVAYSFSLGWVEPAIPESSFESFPYRFSAYLEHLADKEDLAQLESIMEQTVDLIVSVERGE